MNAHVHAFAATCIASTWLLVAALAEVHASTEKQWDFRVFLDDQPIGYHRVRLSPQANRDKVTTDVRLDLKFLFVNVFRYEHRSEETWNGTCLEEISARTNEEGQEQYVRTDPTRSGFRLLTHDGPRELTGCVRSFAYWNPDLLRSGPLLNTQTGEYDPVETLDLGRNPIEIDGKVHEAFQYRLLVGGRSIDLWYTPEREWLALQTTVEGGRHLSYLPARGVQQ